MVLTCSIVIGPNYALAKRMQHWRAMLAREVGCVVSSHIAPSVRTTFATLSIFSIEFALAFALLCFIDVDSVGRIESSVRLGVRRRAVLQGIISLDISASSNRF